MHFRIEVIAVAEDGIEYPQQIADLQRTEATLATLGLTLDESKQVLHALQQIMVPHQVAAYLQQQRPCSHCGKPHELKQSELVPFRTLFGVIPIPNPRWRHCSCQPVSQHTFRPLAALLPERTSPELLYLETRWAALASYGITARQLQEVLPIDHKHSAATVRNHLLQIAQSQEQALGEEKGCYIDTCQAQRDQLPIPDGPLSVGLDGGIVRARRSKESDKGPYQFEVIAGKSLLAFHRDDPETAAPSSKCFALVQGYDKKPKRRLYELLQSQGMQQNQQITFYSDGGDTVRAMQEYLSPEAEFILDWFHITMRLTVLLQCARGLQTPVEKDTKKNSSIDAIEEPTLERRLESIKHYLWHGNSQAALEKLGDLVEDLECWNLDDDGNPVTRADAFQATRMLKYAQELESYIRNNVGYIVNYGERYRQGDRISTGFVESTINQVVSKRMVKKQQMQWTPRGAHFLLQVRTQVLNDDWDDAFRKRYPGFRPEKTACQPLPIAA
jgi:hypothetical protein